MPELPEVETIMRGFQDAFEGHRISHVTINRPDLRWPFPADLRETLEGHRVLSFRRRAKYILMRLDGGWSMLLHLGMSGRLMIGRTGTNATPPTHEHLVLETDSGARAGLVDPRRFGMVDLVRTAEEDSHRLLAHLGVEPLSDAMSGPTLVDLFRGRRSPIKSTLLDQKLIAGLGNIYVCEALFRCGIHPERQASTLMGKESAALAEAIPQILEQAIASGGSSLRDYVQADGTKGGFQDLHLVYGREGTPCPNCGAGSPIQRITQSGRSTFFCPICQE
ncbi:bifunctional DNA-formamidopyrimidine glycosylase/DNA-(apurinic or apyrimidinic site) lyase [Gluconobacter sphaericus]|uniref:bifunctional DNA-formamidopyrimidine glycosylase/DNA-(apurinic or apyrimidinic site) lyase n=1 Tax=Gluconobacter sphaericus TaxID=574987 RepID=UPI001B8AA571|nr:bifunctional DNA-formamidopyrimidine glycosylase/DNA-(apurinic or apyrimidinic site) lyase [Gluconobacter sphaericus]MBS1084941.1 bifunctional DNA-formamidopyrimidine glycosylase/DNA-(apurinic or apyrimidinic site) lyase [Gluconobacter sphaericus]MBS1098841.1 bifunctional DNA-formamidopyrimidine glycosylase/DNA-(apurinic or apyrimidinic site) lyase [Gluconobacter sphaericus]